MDAGVILNTWSKYGFGQENSHVRDGRKLWSNVIKNDLKTT